MKVRINNHLIPHQLVTMLNQNQKENQYPEDFHVDIVVVPQGANSSFQEEFGALHNLQLSILLLVRSRTPTAD